MKKIKEAKKYIEKNIKDGCTCPVCKQFVKEYKTKPINSAMAYVLIIMYRYFKNNGQEKWIHVENYLKTIPELPASLRGDFPKLRHWGLIKMQSNLRSDGSNRVGYYRITKKGKKFVKGKITVSKYIYIFNKNVREFSEENISIKDALKEKFNYRELMRR